MNDFLLSGSDLLIIDGDFVTGESDDQNIADTINAFPGWWKENPQDGVGIFQYLNSAGMEQTIRRSMQIQLQSDGYNSSPIITKDANGNIIIDPNIQ